MNEWKDFTEELPEVGEKIEMVHHQSFFCNDRKKGDEHETLVYTTDLEWIEGDLWRKVR